jgi:hypothetical protein
MNTTDFSIKVLGKTMPLTVLEALGLLEAGIKAGFEPIAVALSTHQSHKIRTRLASSPGLPLATDPASDVREMLCLNSDAVSRLPFSYLAELIGDDPYLFELVSQSDRFSERKDLDEIAEYYQGNEDPAVRRVVQAIFDHTMPLKGQNKKDSEENL